MIVPFNLHALKANLFIFCTPSGMVTDIVLLYWKAPGPIIFTVDGITTFS